jgi:hypothetical protein
VSGQDDWVSDRIINGGTSMLTEEEVVLKIGFRE